MSQLSDLPETQAEDPSKPGPRFAGLKDALRRDVRMSTSLAWDAARNVYLGRKLICDFKGAFGDQSDNLPEIDLVNDRRSIDEFNAATARNSALRIERFEAPLLAAVVDLMTVPAPDMDAARFKAEIANQWLRSSPEMVATAFNHIAADIERLTGVAIGAPDQRAAS